jgi:hypothetical protein
MKGVAGRKVVRVDISKDVTLVLHLARFTEPNSSGDEVALGPHSAQLVANPKTCKNPSFWIRLVGTTLVDVHLAEATNKATWSGSFSMPVQGTYRVDARWYGCDGHGKISMPLPDLVTLQAVGTAVPAETDISLFSNGSSWTSTQGIESGDVELPDYIWKNPQIPAESFLRTDPTDHHVVVKEGTVRQTNGFYAFSELGNYELVW